jgi:hypothetical protein
MTKRTVPTVFGPDTRFELNPAPPVPFRAVLEDEFERLTAKLLRERLARTETARLGGELRRAANEAAALAWVTPFPLLFFPALFDEKVLTATRRAARQAVIKLETRELIAA